MKKIVFLIIMGLFCFGCADTIDQTAILKSEQFCKDKMGIKYIYSSFVDEYCECINGEREQLYNIKLDQN